MKIRCQPPGHLLEAHAEVEVEAQEAHQCVIGPSSPHYISVSIAPKCAYSKTQYHPSSFIGIALHDIQRSIRGLYIVEVNLGHRCSLSS